MLSTNATLCGCGGIGIRARLRGVSSNGFGFKSRRPHHDFLRAFVFKKSFLMFGQHAQCRKAVFPPLFSSGRGADLNGFNAPVKAKPRCSPGSLSHVQPARASRAFPRCLKRSCSGASNRPPRRAAPHREYAPHYSKICTREPRLSPPLKAFLFGRVKPPAEPHRVGNMRRVF